MKTEFSQPRFTGARFDEHTLPVDVARDLAAYETLIVELAKHLYLADHPQRQRVPRGFTASFRLDIESIGPGSTQPVLALVLAGALQLTGGAGDYFMQARDLVAECIAAPADALPQRFPKALLAYFNQLGRSLQDGEAMELARNSGGAVARLTPEARKRLVLAAEQVYERDYEMDGAIEEVDFAHATFRFKSTDGQAATMPMPDAYREDVRHCAGRSRHQVTVRGVAAYDSWDRLQKVLSVDALDVTENAAIVTQLDAVAQLQDGWFDGAGRAPDAAQLAAVADALVQRYPANLPIPSIVPTQDGNLLLEWNTVGDPSLDVDLGTSTASFHAFDPHGADVERDFTLRGDDDWRVLFAFLDEHVRGIAA